MEFNTNKKIFRRSFTMKTRKLISLVLCLMLVVALFAGCGSQKTEGTTAEKSTVKADESTAAAPASNEKIYIPVISKGFQHQFWQAVKAGAEKAAKDYNVEITFEGPENESQVDKQIEMIEAALAKNPKALCLAALDSKACIPLLEKAKAANIPVIGFDSGVDSEIPVATCSTNNLAASALAADKMAELIGGKGKVGIIVHDQTSRTGVDRRDGFLNRMKEKYPDIEVLPVQYGGGDQLKSTDLAKAIITANPDIKGFFGANEGSIIGVLNAAKELNKEKDMVVIGYDSGKQQITSIKDGVEAGAVTQDPIGIGYKAVEAAVKAIKGESVEKNIDTGFHWFDKTNIEAADIKPLLYE
jgi:ribose transport system substrate-binding protein